MESGEFYTVTESLNRVLPKLQEEMNEIKTQRKEESVKNLNDVMSDFISVGTQTRFDDDEMSYFLAEYGNSLNFEKKFAFSDEGPFDTNILGLFEELGGVFKSKEFEELMKGLVTDSNHLNPEIAELYTIGFDIRVNLIEIADLPRGMEDDHSYRQLRSSDKFIEIVEKLERFKILLETIDFNEKFELTEENIINQLRTSLELGEKMAIEDETNFRAYDIITRATTKTYSAGGLTNVTLPEGGLITEEFLRSVVGLIFFHHLPRTALLPSRIFRIREWHTKDSGEEIESYRLLPLDYGRIQYLLDLLQRTTKYPDKKKEIDSSIQYINDFELPDNDEIDKWDETLVLPDYDIVKRIEEAFFYHDKIYKESYNELKDRLSTVLSTDITDTDTDNTTLYIILGSVFGGLLLIGLLVWFFTRKGNNIN